MGFVPWGLHIITGFVTGFVVAVTKMTVETPSSHESSSWALHEAHSYFRKTGRAGHAASGQLSPLMEQHEGKDQRAKHNHRSWCAPAKSARQEDCQSAAHRANWAHQWLREAERNKISWCFTPSAFAGLFEEGSPGLSEVQKQSCVWEKAGIVPIAFRVSGQAIAEFCFHEHEIRS